MDNRAYLCQKKMRECGGIASGARVSDKVENSVFMADSWYRFAVDKHFWIDARFKKVLSRKHVFRTSGDALDIGAGNGLFAEQLSRCSELNVLATDLNPSAIASATQEGRYVLSYDIFKPRPDFIGKWDVVFALDVVEHVEDDRRFVGALIEHLKVGGSLVMNVPALPMLFSRYDEAQGHFRRYNKKTLRFLLSQPNISIEILEYWGACMVPLLFIRKFWLLCLKERDVVEVGFAPPGQLSNQVLGCLLSMERNFIKHPPLGTSLFSIVRRLK